jgi:hypothetical protein
MVDFIKPIINGVVTIRTVNSYAQEFSYILIGRKDHRRSGMRFLVRGSDKNGNVANFAENEEIVIHRSRDKINIMSYNQIRGSIPLIWTQEPNLQLNPLIVPNSDNNANTFAFKKHVSELIDRHNKVVLINLVDKKKDQETIGNFYQSLAKDFKDNNKSKYILTKATPLNSTMYGLIFITNVRR